jgi:PEP-CTERM motif
MSARCTAFVGSQLPRAWGILVGCAVLGFVLAAGPSAGAAVIVNDTWTDGTRTDPAAPVYSENGTDSDADGSIESAWFSSPGTAMAATTGHLTTTQIAASSTSYTTYFTPEANPITLANVGDQLKLTWQFTPTAAAAQANTSQNFRLALVRTPVGSRLTADGTPASAAYSGYSMFMNMSIGTAGSPQVLGNSSPFRLESRTTPATAGDILATGANWTALGTTGATSGNHGYDSGTLYTLVMTLTHNATNGLDIVSTMTGGTLNNTGTAQVTFTDPTPNGGSFAFDTFSIRPSTGATTADVFDTTLFKVEGPISVPEPASLVLIGCGAMALCAVARRRKTVC